MHLRTFNEYLGGNNPYCGSSKNGDWYWGYWGMDPSAGPPPHTYCPQAHSAPSSPHLYMNLMPSSWCGLSERARYGSTTTGITLPSLPPPLDQRPALSNRAPGARGSCRGFRMRAAGGAAPEVAPSLTGGLKAVGRPAEDRWAGPIPRYWLPPLTKTAPDLCNAAKANCV